MKLFAASFSAILWRFYIMMALIIVAVFIGQPLLCLLSVPIFISALMGISFKPLWKSKASKQHFDDYPNEQDDNMNIQRAA